MKKLIEHKKGQFIIIAVLMIAIMIISIGALMNRAVTYYKHEPWEEYLTLISNIELSSRRLVELSLVNYTNSGTPYQNTLKDNLEQWKGNLIRIYPGTGIALNYSLADGLYNVYGTTVSYNLGLNYTWRKQSPFSAANATFTLNIASIGLIGYKFNAAAYLRIVNTSTPSYDGGKSTWTINMTATGEDNNAIVGLKKESFLLSGLSYTDFTVTSHYDQTYALVYTIKCQGVTSKPSQVTIKVWDQRGILVIARYQ